MHNSIDSNKWIQWYSNGISHSSEERSWSHQRQREAGRFQSVHSLRPWKINEIRAVSRAVDTHCARHLFLFETPHRKSNAAKYLTFQKHVVFFALRRPIWYQILRLNTFSSNRRAYSNKMTIDSNGHHHLSMQPVLNSNSAHKFSIHFLFLFDYYYHCKLFYAYFHLSH